MQWSAGPNAGFSTAEPWLPLNEDYAAWNVEMQKGDSSSILEFYRRLIALRGRKRRSTGASMKPSARTGTFSRTGGRTAAMTFMSR